MPLEPFPLAASSWHHSGYHRFLLGADPATLAPLPKPYCIGELAKQFPDLTASLDLQRWRKLYHASFPWVPGLSERNYRLGNVPPHHPLPAEYKRPPRKHAAFDIVHLADPSVSALALVAGDQRLIARFTSLAESVALRVQEGICPKGRARHPTHRMLAAQFVEPNNRWLMPLLHVHSRVLNITSAGPANQSLSEVDLPALREAAASASSLWLEQQSELLSSLGYRSAIARETHFGLRVEGVSAKLLATIEAPSLAVLRLLKNALSSPGPGNGYENLLRDSPGLLASLTEQLERALSNAIAYNRPAKFGFPSEGPWRKSVRQQLSHCCPAALDVLDREARRARAVPIESAIFPNPSSEEGHSHLVGHLAGDPGQGPFEPELSPASPDKYRPARLPSKQLLDLYLSELDSVHEQIVRAPVNDWVSALRRPLAELNELGRAPSPNEACEAGRLLSEEILDCGRPIARGAIPICAVPRSAAFQVPSIDDMIRAIRGPARSRVHEGISRSI